MKTVLALDIGTSKICALAYDARHKRVLACHSSANDTDLSHTTSDLHEQDPQGMIQICLGLLKTLLREPEVDPATVVGIGFSGQMHGVLLVNQQLVPMTPFVTWRDRRVVDLESIRVKWGTDSAFPRTGCRLNHGYGAVTLFDWARRGMLPAGCQALTIADYLAACLSGVISTEPTHAASWGLYHLQAEAWYGNLVKTLGIPEEMLPEIKPTACPIGTLRAEMAKALGLSKEVLVCAPVGDNQASILGATQITAQEAVINLGTGGQISLPSGTLISLPGLETRPMPFAGYILVGASLCGGWAYTYLCQFMQAVASQVAGRTMSEMEVFVAMNALSAQATAGSDGLCCDTRFTGTRLEPSRRGSLSGIDGHNLTPAYLCRAVLEGMVRELREMTESVDFSAIRRIVASGNAVRKNPLVCCIIEGIFERPVRMGEEREEAALGAALATAMGLGLVTVK